MDLKLQTVSVFSSIVSDAVSSEWADQAWKQNFSEKVSSPEGESYEVDVNSWKMALDISGKWLQVEASESHDESSDNFWIALLSSNVSHKLLIPLLVCALDGERKGDEDVRKAITAGKLYLVLLQIPGCSAFKVFQPLIFQRVIDLLKLLLPEDQSSFSVSKRTKSPPKRRGRRGKKRTQTEEEEDTLLGEDMDVSMAGQREKIRDRGAVRREVKQLLIVLTECLLKAAMKDQEALRYHLISSLVKLFPIEVGDSPPVVPFIEVPSDHMPVCVLAWFCLKALCSDLHGNKAKLATEVFNQLLPVVMMLGEGGAPVQQLNVSLDTSSKHALSFIREIFLAWGPEVEQAVKALIQHVCVKVPEKAEYRSHLTEVVSICCREFCSVKLYVSLLDWLYKYSRNMKVNYRVFAIDIVHALLLQPSRQPLSSDDLTEEEIGRLEYRFLVKTLLSRCSDKAGSVRSKALTSLAKISSLSKLGLSAAVLATIKEQVAVEGDDVGGNLIYPMVRRRAVDEKVLVRKAAILALEALIRLDLEQMNGENVSVLRERCQDPALSVRKQSLHSLTSLTMDYPDCKLLHSYWLDGVLPMVMDRETSVQDICATLLEEVILKNIRAYEKNMEVHEVFIWDLLRVMSREEGQEMRRYLKKTCQVWYKQNKLTSLLVKNLMSQAGSEDNCEAAWMLLAEFVSNTKEFSTSFLEKSWKEIVPSQNQTRPFLVTCIFSTTSVVASKLSGSAKESFQGDLCRLLSSFQLSPVVIISALETLIKIHDHLPSGKSKLQQFCFKLMKQCEDYIGNVLKTEVEVTETELIAHLFTLGEVAQLCPSQTTDYTCHIVQGLLLASGGHLRGLKQLKLSQSQSLSELSVPSIVRAHGYVTLGKLSLQHEDVLKKCLLQMVQEMEVSSSEAVRNNIVLVLCDLIVRYPTRVDNYIPAIAACLKDPSVLVRRQTLTLLTGLLQEDYIKWKGVLFYRFAVTLVDEDPEIRRYAEFCFCHLLLTKHPGMFFAHFLDGIFHFNSYDKHKVFNRFKQTEREREMFSLKGGACAGKRMRLYQFFLENMSDEHRFQLAAKLCQEVLGSLVDGTLSLNDDTSPIVKDTLQVLTSKEIKLKSLSKNVAEDLADEGDVVGAAMEAARTKLISQIVKRNVIENIVPTVVGTKHLFERQRSPLLRDLMLFLKELMKDYKEEISDVMASDPQLAEEIKFDLKKFEEDQLKMVQRTPAALTPHGQMISPLLTPGVLGTPAAKKAARILTPPQLTSRRNEKKTLRLAITPLATQTQKMVRNNLQPTVSTPVRRGHPQNSEPSTDVPQQTPQAMARNPGFATPLGLATPHVANTLTKAALLASAKRNTPSITITPMKAPLPPEFSGKRSEVSSSQQYSLLSSETIIEDGHRGASTPQDLSQAVSFNVSSRVPPSPILLKLPNRDTGPDDSKAPPKKRERRKTGNADIILKEPEKLPQWNIHM
jgi:condensin-2 complex subunit D3